MYWMKTLGSSGLKSFMYLLLAIPVQFLRLLPELLRNALWVFIHGVEGSGDGPFETLLVFVLHVNLALGLRQSIWQWNVKGALNGS